MEQLISPRGGTDASTSQTARTTALRNAFVEASEALRASFAKTKGAAFRHKDEYLGKAEPHLGHMISMYSLLLEEISGSEQISELNYKLENELKQESQEVNRLRGRIQDYVAAKEEMSEVNTKLSADLDSCRDKLDDTDHKRVIEQLKSKLASALRELQNTKDEYAKRLDSQATEHTSTLSLAHSSTDLARKQALNAEKELERLGYKHQVDQQLIQTLQMMTDQQAKSIEHFQTVMDQHLKDMADLRAQQDRTLKQNTELVRQSQDTQQLRDEHASLSVAAKEARATIQKLQMEANTLKRRDQEAETINRRADALLAPGPSRKRQHDNEAKEGGVQPDNHKRLRRDDDQVAVTTLVDKVVSSLHHVASLPPPSLMKRLTSFDISDDIPTGDVERTIEEHLQRLPEAHRPARAACILYSILKLKTKREFTPSILMLLKVGYKYANDKAKEEVEKSGSTTCQAIRMLKLYKESDDPDVSEHRRALLHVRVRWGFGFWVPDE
ncbi:hypothetical protein H2200_008056 [Cladophialophora chaetospira]|uniref:Uncharacterized protein n=1 Tax=Cladophialophora chaetospira TaxID=386627 RepID=A0AA39CH23_9EURO|nr:hypothetical protein H2200_008056 [Cladophialophora chaetospira]